MEIQKTHVRFACGGSFDTESLGISNNFTMMVLWEVSGKVVDFSVIYKVFTIEIVAKNK